MRTSLFDPSKSRDASKLVEDCCPSSIKESARVNLQKEEAQGCYAEIGAPN